MDAFPLSFFATAADGGLRGAAPGTVVLRVVTELDVELRLPPETALRLPRTITQARLVGIPLDLAVEQGGLVVEETLVALLGRTRAQIAAVGGVKVLEAKTRHELAHLLHD